MIFEIAGNDDYIDMIQVNELHVNYMNRISQFEKEFMEIDHKFVK